MHRIMLPLAACALVLGACGSGPPSDNASTDDSEQRALQFARCMRDHGVDIPDPQVSKGGGGGNFSFRVGGPGAKGGRGPDPQRVQGAMSACRKYMPNGGKPPSAAQQQEMRDRALRFSRCMRAHGVLHPDPDSAGNFHLTPAQEQRMKRATPKQHERAERACFHFLKPVVSTKPLSARARAQAKRALSGFSRCMAARGYDYFRSAPVVRNLSRGRAFFGFERADPRAPLHNPRFLEARGACERALNAKLDAIIATDRHEPQY